MTAPRTIVRTITSVLPKLNLSAIDCPVRFRREPRRVDRAARSWTMVVIHRNTSARSNEAPFSGQETRQRRELICSDVVGVEPRRWVFIGAPGTTRTCGHKTEG